MSTTTPSPGRRQAAAVLAVAVLAGVAVASATAVAAHVPPPAASAVARAPGLDVRPAGPDESTVTLTFADSGSASARAAGRRLDAEASSPVRSDAEAAGRRALLAGTRLPDAERAAGGQRIRALAARHGLRVVDEGLGYLTLAGDPDALATAFGTTLREVDDAGVVRRVATGPLVVPAALADVVRSAHGLDDRRAMRRRAVPGGYEGRHLRSAYAVPAGTRRGAGTTVGLIQFSGWNASDATTYAQAAGIALAPGQITEIAVNGANPAQPDGFGGELEVALDAEAVLAVAPAAFQRLYFTPNTFAGTVAGYARMAQDAEAGLLTVATTSWGACEPVVSSGAAAEIAVQLRRIVAAGATLTAASGDAGGYGCSSAGRPDARLAVDFPASVPEVLAVGGTRLPPISTLTTWEPDVPRERAWGVDAGDFPAYQGDGSGGGASTLYPRPSYQANIAIPGSTRLVPDVAAIADAEAGLGVFVSSAGGWILGGGTSLASPVVAGLLANAASDALRSTGPGDIHGAIYVNQQAFRDITTGTSNAFPATDGYDRVTGLGVPVMSQLAPRIGLAPATSSPSPTASASPSPTGSPDPSPTAAPQAPTLFAPTTATAGVLITVAGTAAPGAEVELWGVTAPNGTITRVNTPTVLADANGAWSKLIRPLRNVNLQARVGTAVSGTRFIAVSTAVRQSVAALAGCVVQVAGSVFEPKPGATVFMRAVDAAGRTVSLGTGAVEGDGRFLLRRPYACGQRLSVYTVISGDSVNRPGATGTQTITTRR